METAQEVALKHILYLLVRELLSCAGALEPGVTGWFGVLFAVILDVLLEQQSTCTTVDNNVSYFYVHNPVS